MKKNKTNTFYIRFFLIVLFLWIFISLGRTFYNVSKVVTEERAYIGLSDTEKRVKIFGEKYEMILFIQEKTKPSDNIVFFVSDTDLFWNMYFLNIYYLYPRKITNLSDWNEFTNILKMSNHKYCVVISKKTKPFILPGKYKKIDMYEGMEFVLTLYKIL